MIPIVSLPIRIIRIFVSNVAPSEVAAGVCMGMFLGFAPLNSPIALALFICFVIFKINKAAVILVLPVFKLLYILGISYVADRLGGILLIDASFLTSFWSFVTHMPVLALLDLNNTVVAGGLVLSALFTLPVYLGSKYGIIYLRKKYFDKIKNTKLVKWLIKLPLIEKAINITKRLKGEE